MSEHHPVKYCPSCGKEIKYNKQVLPREVFDLRVREREYGSGNANSVRHICIQ